MTQSDKIRMLAEQVMEYYAEDFCGTMAWLNKNGRVVCDCSDFNPFTNTEQAFQLVEKLKEKRKGLTFETGTDHWEAP